ncbi:hypothetical protein ACTOS9_21965 (plasmid) [Bacillus subtilis]|nr:hypothetical protein P5648_22285 [Bacillus subtilis]WGD72661.1 hypothetical protein P5645_22010 [Bacillus subtilis]WGD74661.1 hypothetical protein P5631_00060 [Bacillus subtilis]
MKPRKTNKIDGVSFIEKAVILKLLRKSLLYRLMDNLDHLVSEAKLTHRAVSNRMGNSDNWFNDAYNNNEDIHISSSARLLSVIGQEMDLENHKLISLFDEKILEIAFLIGKLSDEDESYISDFVQADKSIFIDVLGDWASMAYKNKLDDVEKVVMNQVRDLISEEEEDV